MTTHTFLPYAKQVLDESDIQAVTEALKGEMVTRGPKVEAFEKAFAKYCSAPFAVAFNSGSSALEAAYHVAGVSSNDRVLTTPNSFIATVGAAVACGATPVFLDIDRTTGNLNLEHLRINLNQPSTRGRELIVPVHFSGIPVDMEEIDQMIANPNTVVIEDAAHALGSRYSSGERVGSCRFSQMTVFSFHPAKTLTTLEGGMVTTPHEEIYRKLMRFRNNGIERDPAYLQQELVPWYYEVQELTGNYNFTEVQAALGLSQLERLEGFIDQRSSLVTAYRERLQDVPHIRLFKEMGEQEIGYHLFVVQIDFKAFGKKRADIMYALRDAGVGTQVHYIPLYRHPALKRTDQPIEEYFPEMEGYYAEALSLPLFPEMTVDDVDFVVTTLRKLLS